MKETEFAGPKDRLISEPSFWVGVALYAAVALTGAAVFGGTVPQKNRLASNDLHDSDGSSRQSQDPNFEINFWSGPDNRDVQFVDPSSEIFPMTGGGFSQEPPTKIKLAKNQTMLINAAPGETVTLSLKNFTMSGNSILTLQGTASSMFVINVTKQFSLTGSARIALAGDIGWNQVFFKIAGRGIVSLGGHSSLAGIFNASQRTVVVGHYATIWGTVTARKVFLRKAGQIITPPVVSQ